MNMKLLNIFAVGFDQRSQNLLSFFFKQHGSGHCNLTGVHEANVFLINMDAIDGKTNYTKFRQQYPDQPIILMGLTPLILDEVHHYFLLKPMVAEQFITIVKKISTTSEKPRKPLESKTKNAAITVEEPEVTASIESGAEASVTPESRKLEKRQSTGYAAKLLSEKEIASFVGEAEDINFNDKHAVEKLYFDPAQYVLGEITQAYQKAKQEQCIAVVKGLWRPITIIPYRNEVHVELSDRQLQSICVVAQQVGEKVISRGKIEVEFIQENDFLWGTVDQKYIQNLDGFLWKLALWTSRGRIPVDIDLNQPVYLKRWPNFTRLTVTPQSLRIAAYMVVQPRSLVSITENLNIPQRYVFSFFSALQMTGLADSVKREADKLIKPPTIVQATKKSGLFSRILKKIVG